MFLGVDTGGTFTDFVCYEAGELRIHKVLSTPEAPERAILAGIGELGLDPRRLRVVHGSTVATNAVLEGKGARTVFITNRGFADLLTIGRQARRELYQLQPEPLPPPVPPELCLETGGRLDARGRVVEPLGEEELRRLHDQVAGLAPEAVAINLLYSFLDDRFERAIEQALPVGPFVSRSSAVLPLEREYERGITTWLNASVGPKVSGYLRLLADALAPAPLAVMQSSALTCSAAQAAVRAVNLLLSGPAGGLIGARHLAREAGIERVLSFDMGGTSTDVALIDGEIALGSEGRIGPWPVAVPMVEMHTIGAGGGSIARVDAGGLLQVGPQSAGALPGPACYGAGGSEPTVTDANLVLGRLPARVRLGGGMALDPAAARAALERIAGPLGLSPEAAAQGVIRLAVEHMAGALRVISVNRGIDPRAFDLLSFGGAGALHVCELAEAMGMRRALVPVHAGVLSALGMLVAPPGRRKSLSIGRPLSGCTAREIATGFARLAREGREELAAEGIPTSTLTETPTLELRYRGQSHPLEVPWQGDPEQAGAAFTTLHLQRYGHLLELPVELAALRLGLQGEPPPLALPRWRTGREQPPLERVPVHGIDRPVPVWQREGLVAGQELVGPAIVLEAVATTWIAPGWCCRVLGCGSLRLERVD